MMNLYTRCFTFQKLLYINYTHLFPSLDNRSLSYVVYNKFKAHLSTIQFQQCTSFHTSYMYSKRRKTAEERKAPRIIEYSPKAKGEIVEVWRDITLGELAKVLNMKLDNVFELFLNQFESPSTRITDIKVLQQAVRRSGHRIQFIAKPSHITENKAEKNIFPRPPPSKTDLKPRPPVVTVMGHVDHGKTTLLDALRNSSVVDQEFGGITQHIGAFSVSLDSGACITFLDTPGHAAFKAMRARGANLTDIVVLVVAADDGVMEQTIESIRMARQAKVPILVAINKIDSPKADVERTERMLTEVGIQVEKLGGDVQAIPISALKKLNLDQLIDALILQAELLDIGADPKGLVEAVVVESKLYPNRGNLCTVVVQRGTLKKGDILIAGTSMAKVRVLRDAENRTLDKVEPGYPAEIEGWRNLPTAGEQVLQVESEKKAKEVIKFREAEKEKLKLESDLKVIAQKQDEHEIQYKEFLDMKRKMGRFKLRRQGPRLPEIIKDDSGPPSLNIIVKADVDGTLEAILDVVNTYEADECKMDLIHYGVGQITQTDIELAECFDGIIYAFNVEVSSSLVQAANDINVSIKHHNVIYKLIDDIKQEINNRLPLKEVEDILGEATVLQQIEITKGRKKIPIAGCRCETGLLKNTAMYKVFRNNTVIYEGPLSSMRHLKSEVEVIKADMECGLQLPDRAINFEVGDRIICFEKRTVVQKTDWDPGF